MSKIEFKLESGYEKTKVLNFCEYNPRVFTDKVIKDLLKSINDNGFVIPILINSSPSRLNVCIGGNLRLHCARLLKMDTVPVNRIRIDDIEKEKRLNLALNRVGADWDYEALKSFDIGTLLDIGFDENDLSSIWADTLSVEDDDFNIDKAIEEIKVPKSKVGDLYQLGPHRLICGNSEDPEVIKKLVGDEKINVLSCDSVYNISWNYSGKNNKYGAEVKDNRSDQEFRDFQKKTMQNGLAVCHEDAHLFWYCDQNYIGMIQSLSAELGLNNKRVCLWVKNNQNVTPQVAFSKCYEPCVYSTRGNPYLSPIHNLNEILNREIGTGNRTIDDIIDLFDIWLVKRLPSSEYEHATMKPPSLYEKMLRRCTKPNDTVLDLFSGSSSQMLACEALKRRFFGVELEPLFIDLSIRRYEASTGQKAVLVEEGAKDGAK